MDHPLRAWRISQDPALDLDAVADRLAESGKRPSPGYLNNIEKGVDEPGFDLALRIATLIGSDVVTVKCWEPSEQAAS